MMHNATRRCTLPYKQTFLLIGLKEALSDVTVMKYTLFFVASFMHICHLVDNVSTPVKNCGCLGIRYRIFDPEYYSSSTILYRRMINGSGPAYDSLFKSYDWITPRNDSQFMDETMLVKHNFQYILL